MSKSYVVSGMTCEHCVRAVTEEVGAVPGVESVDVHLASGALTVAGEGFADADIAAAVDEAGYSLAS